MNKIDTSQIVDPGKLQPFLGPSLEFLQQATSEAIKGVCYGLIGDSYSSLVGYVLYGVINSPAAVVSFGYIFFNNEIYHFPGITNYNTFSNTGVFVALNTNGTADPITFTDGTTGNVHNVRKLTLVDQANGTGLFNYSAIAYLNPSSPFTVGVGSAPAFQNSFAQQVAVKFRIDNKKRVNIRGVARKLTTASVATQVIFTLPVGYRPVAAAISFNANVLYDTSTLVSDFINIATNGNVSISGFNAPGSIASGVDVYFDLEFYAD